MWHLFRLLRAIPYLLLAAFIVWWLHLTFPNLLRPSKEGPTLEELQAKTAELRAGNEAALKVKTEEAKNYVRGLAEKMQYSKQAYLKAALSDQADKFPRPNFTDIKLTYEPEEISAVLKQLEECAQILGTNGKPLEPPSKVWLQMQMVSELSEFLDLKGVTSPGTGYSDEEIQMMIDYCRRVIFTNYPKLDPQQIEARNRFNETIRRMKKRDQAKDENN